MALTQVSSNKCTGGFQKVFEHDSAELKCKMKFAVYLPPKAETDKCPVMYWLSGLTCTEQNFITKAGSQLPAAEHGIIIVAPDTSPPPQTDQRQLPHRPRQDVHQWSLICALKNPGKYKAVSAFAPICNPIQCPWGQKAFSGYLGSDRSTWEVRALQPC
ncbi:hypothetical protein PAMP_003330 [Pampus punctatissimus]